jgi:hypothetical protein
LISESESQKEPQLKRAKPSEPIPDTIGERLTAKSYASLKAFLSDVSAVRRVLQARVSAELDACAVPTSDTFTTRAALFEDRAKELVNLQRRRLAHVLDYTEEVDHDQQNLVAQAQSQAPQAPTTLGERFPPPPELLDAPVPRPDYSKVGMLWGGTYGPGGIPPPPPKVNSRKVNQPSNFLRHGLEPDFVAAYSSFAPTRNDSHSKVPAAASNAEWWRQHGARTFRRTAPVANMLPQSSSRRQIKQSAQGANETPAGPSVPARQATSRRRPRMKIEEQSADQGSMMFPASQSASSRVVGIEEQSADQGSIDFSSFPLGPPPN